MATVAEFQAVREIAARLTQLQLDALLNELPGVRVWLAGGPDPTAEATGDPPMITRAQLTTKEAGLLLDVERQRLWRWEKQGRIQRVATNSSGPLYMRVDVERLKAEEDERGQRRSRGIAREGAEA